jgi:hypothetical protein
MFNSTFIFQWAYKVFKQPALNAYQLSFLPGGARVATSQLQISTSRSLIVA